MYLSKETRHNPEEMTVIEIKVSFRKGNRRGDGMWNEVKSYAGTKLLEAILSLLSWSSQNYYFLN